MSCNFVAMHTVNKDTFGLQRSKLKEEIILCADSTKYL